MKFEPDSPLGEALYKWWKDLQDRNGDRAELRRAKNIQEVILLPAFHRACRRFRPFFNHENNDNWHYQLAAVLGLLSHVRRVGSKKLALEMASPRKAEPPVLSELRFRRLIQRDRDELYVSLIRVLRILDNQANIYDLAESVYYWGDKVKHRWAFDYFPNTPE